MPVNAIRNIVPRFAPRLFLFTAAFLPIFNAIPSAVSIPHIRRIILPAKKRIGRNASDFVTRSPKNGRDTRRTFLFILPAG